MMEEFDLVKAILNRNQELNNIFCSGESVEISNICSQISSLTRDEILCNISDFGDTFKSNDVIMFSSFDAVFELIEQMLFINEPCTYLEVGKLILKTLNDGAYVKYGENHSKLAQEMKLVCIQKGTSKSVKLTSFGKMVATKRISNIDLILNIFLLSNPLIQTLVYQITHHNKVLYKDYVSNLSRSTQIRRRSNVKAIVKRLIDFFEIENFDLIDWRI